MTDTSYRPDTAPRTALVIDWARIAVVPFLILSAASMLSACWSVADECWKLFS